MSQPQREIHKQRQTAPGVRQWTQCWRAKLATALHTFLNNRIIPIIRLQRPMRLLCGLSPNRGSGVHREIHSGLWAFKVVPANSAFPTLGFVAFLATKSPFACFLTQRFDLRPSTRGYEIPRIRANYFHRITFRRFRVREMAGPPC